MTNIPLSDYMSGSFVGYTGSQGNLGYTGSIGYTGSQGVIGYSGSLGYTGSKGDIGYTGSQGVIGYTGSASTVIGYTGSKGDIGYTGSIPAALTATSLALGGATLGTNNLAVTGTTQLSSSLGIGMTPSNVLDITQNQNAASYGKLLNSNGGGSAQALWQVSNGTNTTQIGQLGTAAAPGGFYATGGGYLTSTTNLGIGSGGVITFGVNNTTTEVARIGTSGNLYLGTTAASDMNTGSGAILGLSSVFGTVVSSQAISGSNVYHTGSAWKTIRTQTGYAVLRYNATGAGQFSWHSSSSAYTAGDNLPNMDGSDVKMTLDASGNLGIGTTSPGAPLEIYSSQAGFPPPYPMIKLNNPSATGQSNIDYYINGTFRGRVRADYVGNMNYTANGGGHYIYVGGDSGTGTGALIINGSGQIYMPEQPFLLAYVVSTVTIDATNQGAVPLKYDGTTVNKGSCYSTSTGLFTAPVSGIYAVMCGAYTANDSTMSQWWFLKNGSRTLSFALNTGTGNLCGTGIIQLAAGDTVGVHPYSSTATSLVVGYNANHTYLQIALIG